MLERAESLHHKTNCVFAFFSTSFSPLTKKQHSRLHSGDSMWLYLLMLILMVFLVEYCDSRVTMLGPKVCMATHGT